MRSLFIGGVLKIKTMKYKPEKLSIGYCYAHYKYPHLLASSLTVEGVADKVVAASNDAWGYNMRIEFDGTTSELYKRIDRTPPHLLAVYSGRKYDKLCYYNPDTNAFFDIDTRSKHTLKSRSRSNFKILAWNDVLRHFGSLERLNAMLTSPEGNNYQIALQILKGL